MTLFTGYQGVGFDEVVGDAVRPHYLALVDRLEHLTPAEFDSRARILDGLFKRQGITFAVYGAEEGVERTWPLDLIPRIIPAHEWDQLERGLIQRVNALNAFLDDLYVGGQAALNEGVVPR